MARQARRVRIGEDGRIEIVDPGLEDLELLHAIHPGYAVLESFLPGYAGHPRALRTRSLSCGFGREQIASTAASELWSLHADILERLRRGETVPDCWGDEASLLDLKVELAGRVLEKCELCAQRCGVNRWLGERGHCLLGIDAVVAEHFVHIAEEAPINPSLVVSLSGCGLRCQFCQQGSILDPRKVIGETLEPTLWKRLDCSGARSLSFIGGNPDESLYAILRFLVTMPEDWTLPVVWNSHAFSTWQTMQLLDGIVDAYVPDFKYGKDDTCARTLSRCKGYFSDAGNTIKSMLEQQVPVIVRILVLPGHYKCCHRPVVQKLASLKSDWMLISVRGQYCPDFNIRPRNGELNRRVSRKETEAVQREVIRHGLRLAP